MTNYNERLEDILHDYAMNLHEYANGIPGHHNDYREQTEQAKQALTSLIKELVAEAKPSGWVYPKDTDELRESIDALLEQVIHIGYVQGYNQLAQMAGVAPYNHIQPLEPEEAKTAIQELIRTEKLKLLAEVRERVVGEEKSLANIDYMTSPSSFNARVSQNQLRNDQQELLKAMEAEL